MAFSPAGLVADERAALLESHDNLHGPAFLHISECTVSWLSRKTPSHLGFDGSYQKGVPFSAIVSS
jgi:hypothetical protein